MKLQKVNVDIQIKSKEIKLVPIAELKYNDKNRNQHSEEQIEQLSKIIRYQGFRSPVIVSTLSGLVVAGHGRLLAAAKLGMALIPAIYQDFEDSEQEFLAGVSDNAIASQSMLDLPNIHQDLKDMGPFDLDLLGIKDFEFTPSELDVNVSEPGIGEGINLNQCPNCGHMLK